MLEIKNLRKIYKENTANAVAALKDVNLKVEDGDFVAIMGESGSGKTTLLNIISLIDKETSGQIFLDGKEYYPYLIRKSQILGGIILAISFKILIF